MSVVVGRVLAVLFLLCFLTGLYSHLLQDPPSWMVFPTRPIGLYRWTQGLHVASGTVAIPVLLAKLWIVYPRLFAWPPFDSVGQALERLSIAVLVSSSLVELTIGLLNTYQWYPWPFPFRFVHFALGWIILGSLIVHIGAKLPVIRGVWSGGSGPPGASSGENRPSRVPEAAAEDRDDRA